MDEGASAVVALLSNRCCRQANVIIGMTRMQSTVGTVYEGLARNALLGTSEAKERHAHIVPSLKFAFALFHH